MSYTSYKVCNPKDLVHILQDHGGKIDGVVVIDGDDQALGYYSLEFQNDSFDGTVLVYRNGVYQHTVKIKDIKHSLYVPTKDDD